ncbi:cyclodeaminase/cyclohydrolase family protein [Porphyromonas levii]|nr:Methenyltetrahydrofolate cyclohydrolase [Porphyromonas levii]MBR8714001.1 Methenyltetrahydrofolate cyclohydrolase [Porphyromonas levii]MBR8716017.1 Methenyltetrahydrofolate cyclohydrolase [Porphyromonas levii]MBR8728548.1 Methenyltetrahydrofolate cyclohydrolase [Porphyromonas levii]MBR8729972.1 Methenyltetrahydrofolate cyclohydrolase [Porphyromonas levii]
MMLKDHTLVQFSDVTAGSDPVPGGGSVSALAGAISASLAKMVANLTIGRKKYAEVESEMMEVATKAEEIRQSLLNAIDRDSDAYNLVAEAFKMPKETDEEKAARSAKIQEATKVAALVPMEVAKMTYDLIPLIEAVVMKGNQNAITDGCIAMMNCRLGVLGALLNVRINLGGLKDEAFVKELTADCEQLEKDITDIEQRILQHTYKAIQ